MRHRNYKTSLLLRGIALVLIFSSNSPLFANSNKPATLLCSLFSTIDCQIEDPEAQYLEGQKHENGEGVPKDFPEALKWYQLAAEQGHAEAAYTVAMTLYRFDQSAVKDNQEEGLRLFRLAAEQGHAGAQDQLGDIYTSLFCAVHQIHLLM